MCALLVPDSAAESPKSKLKRMKHKAHAPTSRGQKTVLLPTAPPPGFAFKFYEVTAVDDLQVRTLETPTRTDSLGNPQKYSPEELKKLKGPDPDLPGYPASYSDLLVGQIVKVYLKKSADDKAPASSTGPMISGRLAAIEESTKKLTVRVQYPIGKGKEAPNDDKEVVMDKVAVQIVIVDPVPDGVGPAAPPPPAK
jgi:hypothetical protein